VLVIFKIYEVYEAAKSLHPERWNNRNTRNWSDIEVVYLNPNNNYEEFRVTKADPDESGTKETA